jgi:hypothetical protein
VSDIEYEYVERSTRSFCDFCSKMDPIMVWNLPDGEHLDMHVVDASTNKIVNEVRDRDGLWSACEPCHKALLRYKKSNQPKFAVKRFTTSVMSRFEISEKFAHIPNVRQFVKKRNLDLFRRLLPKLRKAKPVPVQEGDRVVMRAVGDMDFIEAAKRTRERMNSEVGVTATSSIRERPARKIPAKPVIPDGQTRQNPGGAR